MVGPIAVRSTPRKRKTSSLKPTNGAAVAVPTGSPTELASMFMSKEQLAAELGVSLATLLRWANAGIGPPRIKIGRVIRYDRQQYIEHMRINALVTREKSR